jgi:uncharacterized membrane protein
LAERAIEVVADRGINAHVSPEQWKTLIEGMQAACKQSEFEAGLLIAVAAVTDLLTPHFPITQDPRHSNELSDGAELI